MYDIKTNDCIHIITRKALYFLCATIIFDIIPMLDSMYAMAIIFALYKQVKKKVFMNVRDMIKLIVSIK